jgi:hypothetical protein
MRTGRECERLEVPVASLILAVACTSEARKIKLLVTILGLLGQVLADESVVEAELVGEDH